MANAPLRVIVVGSARGESSCRRALALTSAARLIGYVSPAHASPAALADSGPYDAICVLEPGPRVFELARGHAAAGKTVLVAGPPTEDLADFDRLVEGCGRSGAGLVVGGLLRHRAGPRAVAALAQQGRIGAPVYLRYAAEADGPALLPWHAAEALDLATAAMGELAQVYAVARVGDDGKPRHLAITARHRSGAVGLIGVGIMGNRAAETESRRAGRGHATLLILGDLGAAEADVASGGVLVRDGDPTTSAELRDETTEDLAAWLAATIPLVLAPATRGAELARGRRMVAALEAARRSLASGRPEPVLGGGEGAS